MGYRLLVRLDVTYHLIRPQKGSLPGTDFWYLEDGKIKEFNCCVSVSIMLEQLGIQPDFASAVKAQAAVR